jgi:hypothetical protein
MNIAAFRLWRRAVWSKYASVLETVADAVYRIFCLANEGNGVSETWVKFYEPARPRIPWDGNQLPSSVTALVSFLSAVAMAIVWWKLVLTWVISARLLYRRRRGRLFSPLMPIYVVFSCIMYQETRDPPWAGPFSLQMILIQQKVLWQPLCVADCFLHIVCCPPYACGVTERAICSSRRDSCSGRVVGSVTVGYEAHPASYSVGTRPLLSGLKRPGREADPLPVLVRGGIPLNFIMQ